MEITYKRDIRKSYMVITEEQVIYNYQIEICNRNRIEGLLEYDTVLADGNLQLWYNITGMQSFEEYIKTHGLTEEVIERFIGSIYRVSESVMGYLLEENCICLNLESVYVDSEMEHFLFCYLPAMEYSFISGFRSIVESLMTRVEHGNQNIVELVYSIYQKSLEEHFSIEQIYQIVKEKREHQAIPKNIVHMPQVQTPTLRQVEEEIIYDKPNINRMKNKVKSVFFGTDDKWNAKKEHKEKSNHEMYFDPDDTSPDMVEQHTVFLDLETDDNGIGVLKYTGWKERNDIVLNKDIYLIGSKADADGIIPERGISRLHARITRENGEYYIEDLNSKNGTWVDGELLSYLQKVPLKVHTRVRFAGEEYCFYKDSKKV